MTSRALVFHPGVEDDLACIYNYFEAFDPILPGRFELRLDEQIERIEQFAESGPILFESYRRVLRKRFPYMAVYLVGGDCPDLLAVVHVQRDPRRSGDGLRAGRWLVTSPQIVRKKSS